MIYFILSFIYVCLDQITKFLVTNIIPFNSSIEINSYLSFVNISNTGIAFSLFQNNNLFFIIAVTIVILFFILFTIKHFKEFSKLQLNSLTLIISGGIGNLIDRIFRSAVVDFIDIGYKNFYRWPSFNIADSCVCIGVLLFIISILIKKSKTANQTQK